MALYLDHNATSPMHPDAFEAMLPLLRNPVANPSSLHGFERMARSAVAARLDVDFAALGVDALSLSAHKIRGPQGVGALVRRRRPSRRLISGGDQERKRRGGSENVAAVVGSGRAARQAWLELIEPRHYLTELRDAFESRLDDIAGAVVFAADALRLPNTSFFALPCYRGEMPSMALERAGLAATSGPVCDSAVTEPNHVPRAMGVDEQLALNPIRAGFGMDNTLQQVEQLTALLRQLVERLPASMRRAAV